MIKPIKKYNHWTIIKILSLLILGSNLLSACQKDPVTIDEVNDFLTHIEYAPTPHTLEVPFWLPTMLIPEDNPMTEEGIALGRRLFYDPILSVDSTISCNSCHRLEQAFTDGLAISTGVEGRIGTRNAMSLVNVGFYNNGFFWDGRAKTLEDQALVPIEDHNEMADSWDNVETKLRQHPEYPSLFRKAYGIERKRDLTRQEVVKALAQFERTLISGYSTFERVVWQNEGWLTDSEQHGRELFFFEESQQDFHPGCSHCHGGPLLTDNLYKNNGIDTVQTVNDFIDKGHGGITQKVFDNGKFRVPSLKNIALTAPYMHDGRFQTLEEVIDHYSSGGHFAENLDPNIREFPLTEQDKKDLIAFLHTLTDTSFVNNKEQFGKPF